VPGPAASQGCPDSDGDGVPDHIDKCPDKPGKVEADGCPSRAHIKVQVREQSLELREKVNFEFGKAKIMRESFGLLDQVAATLKQHSEILKLRVEGHTDDKGPDAFNLRLSQKRAESVVDYLVGKGVERERLVPKGFGEEKPIASNKTDAGRAANRRVEMIILERE
jgi:outer membrane protein OmpA-like peptidoglycan-associated protein